MRWSIRETANAVQLPCQVKHDDGTNSVEQQERRSIVQMYAHDNNDIIDPLQ